MGPGGGPTTTSQTTSQNQYPPWLTQNMPRLGNALSDLTFGTGTSTFAPYPVPFGQVAPMSNLQTAGYNQIGAMGTTSPLLSAAEAQQQNTLGGGYLNPNSNPYLRNYYNDAAYQLTNQYENVTAPSVLFSGLQTGTLGSTANQNAASTAQTDLSTGLGTLGANIYEPAYQQERSLQEGAAQRSPYLTQGMYIPATESIQAGGQLQGQLQNVLNQAQQNLGAQGMWPYQVTGQTISDLQGLNLGGPLGQTSTQTQQSSPSALSTLTGFGK
jgi:hypothetical protein